MKGRNYRAGDVLSFPASGRKVLFAWIIYVSEYFKDLVGLLVYNEDVRVNDLANAKPLAGPFYTNAKALRHYGWEVIGNNPVELQHIELTRRLVGGAVLIGDQRVGQPTPQEIEHLTEMSVEGVPSIIAQV